MDVKIKNRHRLKQKDKKQVLQMLADQFGEHIQGQEVVVEKGRLDDVDLIFLDADPMFFIENDVVFFTIIGLLELKPKKRRVIVDMGAVRFVTNGADVMAPGIVDADISIEKGQQIWICDERHHKPLAVGIALLDGNEMISADKGKAVKLKHYIGDGLWKKIQSIEKK